MIAYMESINSFLAMNIPLFSFIAVLAGIVIYWKTGGFNVQNNIIENFRVRVEQLEKDVVRLTAADAAKSIEIGHLRGVIIEKDKYINLLKEVSIDRNPQMKEFVSMMKEYVKRNESRDERSVKVLEEIEKHFAAGCPLRHKIKIDKLE